MPWLVRQRQAKADAGGDAAAVAQQAGSGGPAPSAVAPSWPDPVLEHLMRSVRSTHVRRLFFSNPASQYTAQKPVTLLAGTYNVAGKKPPEGLLLHPWLARIRFEGGGGDGAPVAVPTTDAGAATHLEAGLGPGGPDLVIVGFQEVVPLSAGNVIAGPTSGGADAWDRRLAATLNGEAWAARNCGRTYGSRLPEGGALGLERFGSQAAYAYSVMSNQANYVLGSSSGGGPAPPAGAGPAAAEAAERRARLAAAIDGEADDEVYVQVACKQMVGLYLSLWARRRVARHIRGVQSAVCATGFGGYLGNKGAVAVRLRVYDAPLCVVVAHLASGEAEGDEARRNADAADILKRLAFATEGEMAAAGVGQLAPVGLWGEWRSVADHGNALWLGDLNYRLNLPLEEARRLLRSGQLERLAECDQLSQEMGGGRAFRGWREGAITFPPTYKYHLGCDVYSCEPPPPGTPPPPAAAAPTPEAAGTDEGAALLGATQPAPVGPRGGGGAADGSDDEAGTPLASPVPSPAPSPAATPEKQKKRTPAWCDRILWLPSRELQQQGYWAGPVRVSDHRPVGAAFALCARAYQRERVAELLEAARREADAREMAARPRCTLSPNVVDLGLLPYGVPTLLPLALTNTGTVAATFTFVAPPRPRLEAGQPVQWEDDQPLAPAWLEVAPLEGGVDVGATQEVRLRALLAGGDATDCLAPPPPTPPRSPGSPPPPPPLLPRGPAPLEAILVLRVTDGSDLFCAVSARGLPSSWGRSLDRLAALGAAAALDWDALGEEGRALAASADAAGADAAAAEAAHVSRHVSGGGGGSPPRSSDAVSGAAEAALPALTRRLHEHLSLNPPLPHSAGAAAAAAAVGLVPKEVAALTGFLAREGRLSTPGLFVQSCDVVCGRALRGRQAVRGQRSMDELVAATAGVRWALDLARPLPHWTTPHQAAAALLCMFAQLPDGFIPASVAAVCAHYTPPPSAVERMLSDAMTPSEWAVLRHTLALLRAALHPAHAARSGVTLPALAAALVPYWLPGVGVTAEADAARAHLMMGLLDAAAAAQLPLVSLGDAELGAVVQRGTQAAGVAPAAAAPLAGPPQESLI